MPDLPAEPDSPRPRPRYGEYATPEEVAAARGPSPAEPTDPVSRLAAPIASRPSARAAEPVRRPSPSWRLTPPPGRPLGARHPRPANNLITVLLLVFGIWNTVTSIPSYLDFGAVMSQAVELGGYGPVTFGPIAHTAGIVLLVISLLLLIAAVGFSLRLMGSGRRSIWVPVTAGALFLIASIVVMTVVVANTPALLQVLHNH
ncbi:MAG TPA: DUF6264 family protein [Pseudolysinimonas sp.]|nr:DUF6264 family protein [Pseudolysinimonas sp.]